MPTAEQITAPTLATKVLRHPALQQTVRFGIISVFTALIDYVVLIILSHLLPHSPAYLSLAVASGYSLGTIVHFFAARKYVFSPTQHHVGVEFMMVFVVGIIGLGLTEVIVIFLEMWLRAGITNHDMRVMVAKAIAIVIVFFWNYGARRMLIYNQSRD